MKDIFFYWSGKEPTHKYEGVRRKFPTAKFVKLQKNPVATAKAIASQSLTTEFWLLSIDLEIPKSILDTAIPAWDKIYAHVFMNEQLFAYLVPKSYQYNSDELAKGHFENKKVIETNEVTYRPYDIFFLSYDEENADANWKHLLTKYQHAVRVHGVKGIFNAHLKAATQSTTDFFWVVDADSTVTDTFTFDYRVPDWDFDVVHIWNSRNVVNGLEYGYGGTKLIPRYILLTRADKESVDVTTSIGSKIKLFDQVSNINNFATTPFNAWRSGFREAVKLSGVVIKRRNDEESATRLEAWCNVNLNHPLGEYVLDGANLGKRYGTKNQQDRNLLALINDYDWLLTKFNEYVELKKLNLRPSEK